MNHRREFTRGSYSASFLNEPNSEQIHGERGGTVNQFMLAHHSQPRS